MSVNDNAFNGAETNCGIAHILGIVLMNSYNTDIFFSNYYNLQSVHFELYLRLIFSDFILLFSVERKFNRQLVTAS